MELMGSRRLAAGGPYGTWSSRQHQATADALSASAKVLGTQQLHHSQDQHKDVITWLCCNWQSRGHLLRLALCSLPQARQRGAESTSCAAVPEGKHLYFAKGVHVSVRTKSDKHPVFLPGLDAGSAPLTPGHAACRAEALLATWMLSPACHFRQFSNTCPASC